jgi:hypothetical protein
MFEFTPLPWCKFDFDESYYADFCLTDNWQMTSSAIEKLTHNLRSCLAALPIDDHYAAPSSAGGSSQCTVGLMLNECTIDDTLPGSPAHVSQKLKAGDVITAVDGDPVTKDNVLAAIRGRDVPGTSVVITARSADQSVKTVVLLRQLRATAFDRRDLMLLLGHVCNKFPISTFLTNSPLSVTDEVRANAAAQLVEQRGKKKADDELMRFRVIVCVRVRLAISTESTESSARTRMRASERRLSQTRNDSDRATGGGRGAH